MLVTVVLRGSDTIGICQVKKTHHTMYGNGNMFLAAYVIALGTGQRVSYPLVFRMLLLGLLNSSREGDRISHFL